jgi:hypothetical protein
VVMSTGEALTVHSDDGRLVFFKEKSGAGYHQYLQELPPRPDLQEGWELTGKAAKIDGTQELAEGEIYAPLHWSGIRPNGHEPNFNKWRHISRKIDQEEPTHTDECLQCHTETETRLMVHGVCNHCMMKFIDSLPR